MHGMTGPVTDWTQDVLLPAALVRQPARMGGRIEGDLLRGRLIVENGKLVRLASAPKTSTPQMILPRLVEPHCHLDKCHTIHRLDFVAGDLSAAIAAMSQDKALWTEEDLRHRATRGLAEAQAAGCGAVRSHVDWSDTGTAPRAWAVLQELARDMADRLHLQCAALAGIDQMADDRFCADVARNVAQDGGVLGGFILSHERVTDGLRHMFAAADRFSLPLDFHVDEGLGSLNGLEAIADMALATRFQGPILCGHAVSLMDRAPDDFARISGKLAQAGISVCALPTTNLYLQDRSEGTPDRRGLTKLRELDAAGVAILVGSDNVGDAFCPVGAHDPMAALHLTVLTGHLDPPLDRWLPAITTHAAQAMGLPQIWLDGAHLKDLLISDASHLADLISGRALRIPVSQKNAS